MTVSAIGGARISSYVQDIGVHVSRCCDKWIGINHLSSEDFMVTSSRHAVVLLAALATAAMLYVLSPVLIQSAYGLMPPEYLNAHSDAVFRWSVLCISIAMASLAGWVIGRFIPDRPAPYAAVVALLINVPMLFVNRSRSVTDVALVLVLDMAVTVFVAVCVFAVRAGPDRGGRADPAFAGDTARMFDAADVRRRAPPL